MLVVVRSNKVREQLYTGLTEIRSGWVAEDLAAYMADSEQTSSMRERPEKPVVSAGVLAVVRSNKAQERPYTGLTEIRSGEVAEDLAGYLADSEQTNSALALGVSIHRDASVRAAGGYLVQVGDPCHASARLIVCKVDVCRPYKIHRMKQQTNSVLMLAEPSNAMPLCAPLGGTSCRWGFLPAAHALCHGCARAASCACAGM